MYTDTYTLYSEFVDRYLAAGDLETAMWYAWRRLAATR